MSLADWSERKCLVLLGEGGLGKSHELEAEGKRLAASGAVVVTCDLASTTDRGDLRDLVLPTLVPGEDVTLLIDGFDEVFDDVNDIADVLGRYLGGLDHTSVSVRIASRPVVWSTRLEEQLRLLWPEDIQVLTLQPISQSDIAAAAEAELTVTSAADFIRLLGDRDLWSLAASPITLGFLLDRFRESGALGSDRLAVHRDGIAHLISESQERRVDRRRLGPPKAERVVAAETLAYLSMFGGKPVVGTKPTSHADAVNLDDVAGRDGFPQGTLDAVAQSGVFRPVGTNRVAWAHRSFAEVLAADRIRDWPLPTLLNVLTQPTAPNLVAPQLVGVANWASVTRSDLFDWLLEHDLHVVVDTNLADLPVERRSAVAQRVLERVLAGESFDWRPVTSGGFVIGHLVQELSKRLVDPSVGIEARIELVQLVWRAKERGVDHQLVSLVHAATDVTEYGGTVSLGRWAVIALEGCTDKAILAELVGMARASVTNRWIREDLLLSLHPDQLTAREVLDLIPDDAFSGMDTTFLGLVKRIEGDASKDAETLTALLHWLASAPDTAHHDHFFLEAVTSTLPLAIPWLDDQDVLAAVGTLVTRHAEIGHTARAVDSLSGASPNQRRAVLEVAVELAVDQEMAARIVAHHLVDAEDFDYFVDRLADLQAADPASITPDHWAVIAAHAAFSHAPSDQLIFVAESAKARHAALAPFIEQEWGLHWRTQRARADEDQSAREDRLAADQAERCFDLERVDAAIVAKSWSSVVRELQKPLQVDGPASTRRDLDHPLSSMPAWQQLDDARRTAVVELGWAFIKAAPALQAAAAWVGDAIALLVDVSPEHLDTIDGGRWLELVPLLAEGIGHYDTYRLVVERAATHDRHNVDALLLDALRADVRAGHAIALDRFGIYEPTGLQSVLLELAAKDEVEERSCQRLLEKALDLGVADAAEVAFAIINGRPAPPEPNSAGNSPIDGTPAAIRQRLWGRAVSAGAALATAPASTVDSRRLLAVLVAEWEFTSAIVARLGIHPSGQLLAALSSDEIATLFLWLDPLVEKPVYAPGRAYPSNSVHDFPNTLLTLIGGREDPDSADALDRIGAETDSRNIADYAARVRRAARAATWQPIAAAELRQLAADTSRRVTRTSEQLAVVVHDVLLQYGDDLRSNAAIRQRLWNRQAASACYVPLDEEAISDELRLELKARLGMRVTVHREVRIEPRIGGQAASEIDLLVTVTDDESEISCIVEVKANWYANLLAHVQSQLAARYLMGPEGNAGVFLIMWFAGDAWCDTDTRRRRALKDRRRIENGLAAAVADVEGVQILGLVIDCRLEQHA